MKMRRTSVFAGVGLGLVAVLVTASPSLAATVTNVQLIPNGVVDAKGAAVTISVTYTCASDQAWNYVGGEITEKVGNKIAHAYVSTNPVCDGATHTVDLVGIAQDVPFKVGTAFVSGSVTACDSNNCASVPFSGDVRLAK